MLYLKVVDERDFAKADCFAASEKCKPIKNKNVPAFVPSDK